MKFTNKEETQRHLQICIAIESHLIKKGLLPKREWYLVLDQEDRIVGLPRYEITRAEKLRRERYRCPDILWWDDGLWILEVDGYVHYVKSSKTEKRNKIYKNNNCHFIIIETFEMIDGKVKNKSIEKILKELDDKLKTLITTNKSDK